MPDILFLTLEEVLALRDDAIAFAGGMWAHFVALIGAVASLPSGCW